MCANEKIKVLIDTDLGDDVDDALTFLLAAASKEMELVGVTTVLRDTVLRAKNVKKLLSHLDMDVPVYAGKENPITGEKRSKDILLKMSGTENFTADNEDDFRDGESALDYIFQTANSVDHLHILAIGPLTNIAAVILKYPQIKNKISKIVLMGGDYFNGRHEWNILSDPLASKTVFESGIPVYAVGTDVTKQVKLNNARQSVFLCDKEKTLSLWRKELKEMILTWIEKRGADITLHDPLALYAIIKPDVLHFKKQRVFVSTEEGVLKGLTVNLSATGYFKNSALGSEIFVADYVAAEEMMEDFMRRLSTLA